MLDQAFSLPGVWSGYWRDSAGPSTRSATLLPEFSLPSRSSRSRQAARTSPSPPSISPKPTSAIRLQDLVLPASSRSALVWPWALQIPRSTSRVSSGSRLISGTFQLALLTRLTVVVAHGGGESRLRVLLSGNARPAPMASLPFHDTERGKSPGQSLIRHRSAASATSAARHDPYAAKRPGAPPSCVTRTSSAGNLRGGPGPARAASPICSAQSHPPRGTGLPAPCAPQGSVLAGLLMLAAGRRVVRGTVGGGRCGAPQARRLANEIPGDERRVGRRIRRQQERLARRLVEVEVAEEIAQDRLVFPDIGAAIRPAVGLRVEPGIVQKIILDELQIGIAAEDLMVDVALPGVRRDDDAWHTQAVAVLVGPRWHRVVVEAAPVVPGHEDGGRVPVRALHGRVDERGHIGLPLVHAGRRMLAVGLGRDDPGDRR